MYTEPERLVADTPPTQDQLHQLASIGMRSAISRERVRQHQSYEHAHFFNDHYDAHVNVSDLQLLPSKLRHEMAIRVGARPATEGRSKLWSLKLIERFRVRDEEGVWRAEHSTYRFQWTRSQVLMADRTLKLVGFDDIDRDVALDWNPDTFSVADDLAEFMRISQEFGLISEGDCEELIKDTSDYFATFDSDVNSQ